MRIIPTNIVSGANNAHTQALEGRRAGGRSSRRDNIVQERIQEKRREMQIRAREDEQIKALQKRMQKIKNSDMDFESRMLMLSSLADRIEQIHENRAEREVLAAEREMQRQKALLEEHARAEERAEQDDLHKDPEEAEEAKERSLVLSLSNIAVSKDNLSALKQTRAAMAGEAGHLRRAIEFDRTSGNSHEFRNQQLKRLTLGIARTDAAIQFTISSMYRESAKLQESQLAQYRQQPEEKDDDDEVTHNM